MCQIEQNTAMQAFSSPEVSDIEYTKIQPLSQQSKCIGAKAGANTFKILCKTQKTPEGVCLLHNSSLCG